MQNWSDDLSLVTVLVDQPNGPVDQDDANQATDGINCDHIAGQFTEGCQSLPSQFFRHAVILLLLLWPSSVFAQGLTRSDKLFIATVPAFSILAYQDARDTRRCVEAGRCVEINPVWAGIARTRGIRRSMQWKLAAQASLAGGLGYAMHRWPERKPFILAAFITMTALQGVVNVHNKRTLETAHR